MPLEGPSSSRNTAATGHNHSESHGTGAATGLVNGSSTPAKPKRNKGKGSGTATPLLDKEKLPATFEGPSFEDNVDFIAFELEPHELSSKGEQEDLPVGERDRDAPKFRERDGGDSKKRTLDFDQNDGYNNKKERTNAASRKAPWVTDVDWEGSINVAELYAFSPLRCIMTDGSVYRLHREVDAFVRYVSPTREEDEVRSLVVAQISQAITRKFPDAKVLAFGSYETKLYLPLGYVADATSKHCSI